MKKAHIFLPVVGYGALGVELQRIRRLRGESQKKGKQIKSGEEVESRVRYSSVYFKQIKSPSISGLRLHFSVVDAAVFHPLNIIQPSGKCCTQALCCCVVPQPEKKGE